MSFDWREYLALAMRLASGGGVTDCKEAADRSAVSRAYYAAFCVARNYAVGNLGFRPKGNANVHRELREFLQGQGHVQMASDLNKLRQWRNDCDYENQVPGLPRLVGESIEMAQKIIQGCE